MKNQIPIFAIILILGLSSCERRWRFLRIKNNSQSVIHSFPSEFFPDTTLQPSSLNEDVIFPGESGVVDFKTRRDEYVSLLNNKTFILHIVSEDSFDVYGFDTVAARDLVLKRYDLSLDELEGMDWLVEYP